MDAINQFHFPNGTFAFFLCEIVQLGQGIMGGMLPKHIENMCLLHISQQFQIDMSSEWH